MTRPDRMCRMCGTELDETESCVCRACAEEDSRRRAFAAAVVLASVAGCILIVGGIILWA